MIGKGVWLWRQSKPSSSAAGRRDSPPVITSNNSEGIRTIIWAMGYTADYSLVKLPVVDEDGFPIQQRGAAYHPGLYFVGTTWLNKRKSPILLGVNEDAEHIVAHMTGE